MRLPYWIKTKHFTCLHSTKQILRSHGISTVCEEARCPNIGLCFSKPTAAFLILGPRCTRQCGFCSVDSAFLPLDPPAADEPERIARTAQEMGLKYVVITSVTRDDLPDGGALHFARTIKALRDVLPDAGIEVLIPDFKGDMGALKVVLHSEPDVVNHNVETVPRLYPLVRPQANYERSLYVLKMAKKQALHIRIKSGIMVGLGETFEEIVSVMKDLSLTGCDFLTIGQYLQPSKRNLPVVEYVEPRTFVDYKKAALRMGFKDVASSPLVRSSMNAEEMFLS